MRVPPPRIPHPLRLAAGAALAAVLVAPPAHALTLTLDVRDASGRPLQARARVQDEARVSWPRPPVPELLANDGNGGYFYLDGQAAIEIPPGQTRLTIGRGFEWTPLDTVIGIAADTTVHVVLNRFADLAVKGWFCGDTHVHTDHPPVEYAITPAIAKRVAQAEGLSITWLLDQGSEFTGGPHALSDSANVLWYAEEQRNQTYGHADLLGLQQLQEDVLALAPAAAYPMLIDTRANLAAQGGGLMVLAHPRSTEDYLQQCCWPGAGLGRELPVLAALGALDAMEVASYSNEPDVDLEDWYALLSLGFAPAPAAGTDAALDWRNQPPAGGWRVYAQLPFGQPFTPAAWLASLKAGRAYVTGFPLIEEFTVNGRAMGQALEVAADSFYATIRIHAKCAISVRRIALVADGQEIWSRPYTTWPPVYDKDTVLVMRLPTPGWMALKVEPPVGIPQSVGRPALAHSNAIRFTRGGQPRRDPEQAQRFLDELDQLEALVLARGGWVTPGERDTVLARIGAARGIFLALQGAPLGVAASGRAPERPRAYPSPGFGPVRFADFGGAVDVFDVSGRRLARVAAGGTWDGRDGGRNAAPGLYLARSADGRRLARFVRLR